MVVLNRCVATDPRTANDDIASNIIHSGDTTPCDVACLLAVQKVVSSPAQQTEAVRGVINRILGPTYSELFRLNVTAKQEKHFFTVEVIDTQIHISGSSGVDVASGIHWFLKYWTQSSYSWEATGGLQLNHDAFLPESLAEMQGWGRAVVDRQVPFSYYQNVVTLSYSMAYWDWQRWQQEIDWMALQGVNLPLAPAGIEYVWLKTFGQFGITAEDLADFFPGPSFLAWGRMGNLQGYSGPLPLSYMAKQADLQRKIVERMRALGMTPVFPGFAGFVPRAFVAKHPRARVSRASPWAHFSEPFCSPYMLDPTDPLFQTLGAAYIKTLRREFGWDDVGFYIADSFNEMRPSSAKPEYLRAASSAVYASITAADPGAVWLMQAWLFFSDQAFWQPPQIQALLQGAPRGRLILLDLFAEEHPIWERTRSFYGCPFIWCMLHNFGGNLELYGALPAAAAGFRAACTAPGSTCVGMGMAPEGLEQNPLVYEFAAELAFRQRGEHAAGGKRTGHRSPGPPAELAAWAHAYGSRRYGGAAGGSAAAHSWALLAGSAYSCGDRTHNTVCDIPTSRPALSRQELVGWGLAPHAWYHLKLLLQAWQGLIQATEHAQGVTPEGDLLDLRYVLVAAEAQSRQSNALVEAGAPSMQSGGHVEAGEQSKRSSALDYDLVDLGRELLSKLATEMWSGVVHAYFAGDLDELTSAGEQLLELLADMEQLLSCHRSFLLGRYLAAAKGFADTPQEEALYELNARTQITIWGTSASGDSEVSDYANREWAGLLGSFYVPRWRMWLRSLEEDLRQGRPYDASAWRQRVLDFTLRWAHSTDSFPENPSGDALAVSRQLYAKYASAVQHGCSTLR